MAEDLRTRAVLQQVDARLSNLELNTREMRTETNARFDALRSEISVNGQSA